MKKIFVFSLLSFVSNLFSQCLTDHYHKEIIKKDPSLAAEDAKFFAKLQTLNGQKRATKYIIPVVFHVLHTNGPENISKAQIEDQIRILNLDFSLTNTNKTAIRTQFKNLAADCQIEFRLAKVDPSGNCTDGINRVYTPQHVDARDNIKNITGARWDNKKYLNIWVVSSIQESSGSGGTTLGYAYFPNTVGGTNAYLDGIVVRSDWVGTIGTGTTSGAGRTMTHEVGHYLGLLHTFQDGCNSNDDYCDDTPPVAGTFTNASCPANNNSCTSDFPDIIDQWENYMDYSSGSCQAMFTLEQKARIDYTLTTYSWRISMVSSANLRATGVEDAAVAPKAYFTSNYRTVCVGQPVTYYDNSCKGLVDSRQWQFTGASTFTTNKDTPVVTYAAPGKYKVTLISTNSYGSNTLAVDNYIEVLPARSPNVPDMKQGFEDAAWLTNSNWKILDPGATKLITDNTVAFSGTTCLKAPITASVPEGQRFQLVSPSIDLRSLKGKNPKLSLMLAYARVNVNSSEKLRFFVSRGCSGTWTQVVLRQANFIAYNSTAYTTNFKPTSSSQWKLITYNLSAYENDSNIQVMIEVESGSGNSVYIDDINIGQFNTDVRAIEKSINLNVYPNPSVDQLTVKYENTTGETEVWLENIEGKKIETILAPDSTTGEISIDWTRNNSVPTGVYILKIRANNQVITKKVIFAN
ncbi:MAG: M43 family zinc metalloprotease [Bacteroidota bacterium]